MLDLTSGAGNLTSILDVFTFGNRITLSKLAWSLAEQAPLFGHGSRMFTNLAVEFFRFPIFPISPIMSMHRPPAITDTPDSP